MVRVAIVFSGKVSRVGVVSSVARAQELYPGAKVYEIGKDSSIKIGSSWVIYKIKRTFKQIFGKKF